MKQIVDRFIDTPYPYDFERGPDVVQTHEDARLGLNCTALTHLAIKDMYGEELPPTHKAYEMYTDYVNFEPVSDLIALKPGDLLWFGLANPLIDMKRFLPKWRGGPGATLDLANWADCPVRHVGMFTGEVEDGDPQILHASRYVGACAVEPLSEVCARGKHAKIYDLRRYLSADMKAKKQEEHEKRMVILNWRLV